MTGALRWIRPLPIALTLGVVTLLYTFFGDRRTDDVMVPRTDIVGVSEDATVEDAIEVALESGHRRLVVYEATVDRRVPGVVFGVYDSAGTRYERAFGSRDLSTSEPMQLDAVHQIMSMTKPIAGLACLLGVERGLLDLDQPARELLPELNDEEWRTESKETHPADDDNDYETEFVDLNRTART